MQSTPTPPAKTETAIMKEVAIAADDVDPESLHL